MPAPAPSHVVHRLSIAAAAVLALGAVGMGGYNLASADISEGDRPVFVPVNPCRLVDTRSSVNVGPLARPLGPGETATFRAHGANGRCTGASAVPSDAVALSMNVTALRATQRSFLTFWGDGPNPGTANLNPDPGNPPIPNSVNTPLSSAGNFNLYNDAGTVEVVIDVNGYYSPHDHDDRYYTEAESNSRFVTADDIRGRYLTPAQIDDRYYTNAEADARFLDTGEGYTRTQAENRFLDTGEADSRYVPQAALGGTNFIASGVIEEPNDDGSGAPAVAQSSAPPGVTVTVDGGADQDGAYRVTLTGTSGRLQGTVQLTAIGDPSPGDQSPTRVCALGDEPDTGASSFAFDVGCLGESDVIDGDVVQEDSSFHFFVVGSL